MLYTAKNACKFARGILEKSRVAIFAPRGWGSGGRCDHGGQLLVTIDHGAKRDKCSVYASCDAVQY